LKIQVNNPDYEVQEVWAAHQHLPNYDNLIQAAKDTFDYLPKQYDPRFKNPCWYPEPGGPLKCLPYFQILGVSKCGTTDLYHRLTFNPEMVECPWKGPHFWDEAVHPARRRNDRYDGSFPAYVSVFDKPAKKIAESPRTITGEASSNTFTGVITFCRGPVWPRKLNVTLAQYLWEATPFARYIVLFRNPVDRYYSAYYYYRPKSAGPGSAEDFHRKAKSDIQQWRACVAQRPEWFCLRDYVPQQLVKGMYAAFLPPWFEVWPRSRFLFMRTEDYKRAPIAHVAAATAFLGLTNMTSESLQGAVQMPKANAKRYQPMLPETRMLLQNFYRPFNQRLVEALGGDRRWLWGY